MSKILERIFHRRELKALRSKYENFLRGQMIPLTQVERKMVFDALCAREYKQKVQSPATHRFIRICYSNLKAKIASSIKEMG
jgi:hypothetical protein